MPHWLKYSYLLCNFDRGPLELCSCLGVGALNVEAQSTAHQLFLIYPLPTAALSTYQVLCATRVLLWQHTNQRWSPTSPSPSPQAADQSVKEAGKKVSLCRQYMAAYWGGWEGTARVQHGLVLQWQSQSPISRPGSLREGDYNSWPTALRTKHPSLPVVSSWGLGSLWDPRLFLLSHCFKPIWPDEFSN